MRSTEILLAPRLTQAELHILVATLQLSDIGVPPPVKVIAVGPVLLTAGPRCPTLCHNGPRGVHQVESKGLAK